MVIWEWPEVGRFLYVCQHPKSIHPKISWPVDVGLSLSKVTTELAQLAHE